MKQVSIFFIGLFFSSFVFAGADMRRHPDNEKVAKEAATYIVKEGQKMPKGTSQIALAELKKICTNTLHKGCYFWKKGSEINFRKVDSKGEPQGKTYDLSGWLKRLFQK